MTKTESNMALTLMSHSSKGKKPINVSLQCKVWDNRNRVIWKHKTGVFQFSLEGLQKASRGDEGFHCLIKGMS